MSQEEIKIISNIIQPKPILPETVEGLLEDVNDLFQSDEKSKKSFLGYSKQKQAKLLKLMKNPELQAIWNSYPESKKKEMNNMDVYEKYNLLSEQKKKAVVAKRDTLDLKKKGTEAKEDKDSKEDVKETTSSAYVAPPELFSMEEEEEEEGKKEQQRPQKTSKQSQLDEIVNTYFQSEPFRFDGLHTQHELEVRFGTKGIKPLTRIDYDNVIKYLLSNGFKIVGDTTGQYLLRIQCEFLDSVTGRIKLSDIRTEINGLHEIQKYCESNHPKSLNPSSVVNIQKKPVYIQDQRILPVDFDDFNFRVSYQVETTIKKDLQHYLYENWNKSKKEFRFINRVTLQHPAYPCKVDISITKHGKRGEDRFGKANRGPTIRTYTMTDSHVLQGEENYEIEIEMDNRKIGPSTPFVQSVAIADVLRKTIKYVLCGLQKTAYPISYPEQKQVLEAYMKLIWKEDYDPARYISSKYFIGPNSITLQLANIAENNDNPNDVSIRKDFLVTDKADGERHLLFVAENGKIYLINTNMHVIFTGAKTKDSTYHNTLIDGELISHDKYKKYLNLYAAFDVYYFGGKDVREYTFVLPEAASAETTKKTHPQGRYSLLKRFEKNIQMVSILSMDAYRTEKVTQVVRRNADSIACPLRFQVKEFYPFGKSQTIFDGCNDLLQKQREDRFEYITDGLIFTHAFYGVGANTIGKAGPKTKITWEYSFKWKPPQYNTIDFLVTTLKTANGDDIVQNLYEDGINNAVVVQNMEYKRIELRCGFKESKDGFINPCQDIIDDKLPETSIRQDDDHQEDDYVPMRFYPTEPYDVNAGLCNIMLRSDGAGGKKMFSENNEVFEDNTIVEFRYDFNQKEGWNWIPLRVRYDKTTKLRRGEKEYGNAYKVCNENWKSIQPNGRIDEEMLCTGQNIPSVITSEDIYYNTSSSSFNQSFTKGLKNFHNLVVKKKLITCTTHPGDTLIDFACGKAGDLPKWIAAKLSFVFGMDISKDGLENRLDGACARFLKSKKSNKYVPYALFVNANAAYNIRNGTAMLNEKAKQITMAVFGQGIKDEAKLGKGVVRQYGKGTDGFHVSSCQFAIHYFFENMEKLTGFMRNVAECTRHNGYFIGTCYDGKLVFNELRKLKMGESVQLKEEEKTIWKIVKEYSSEWMEDNSTSVGYKIDVYQESINQFISEYLVNFDYFNQVMSAYGLEIISNEEAKQMGLPNGSGLFRDLYMQMLDDISRYPFKAKEYGQAINMTPSEKKISFLNRYFVYKKVRVVNIDKLHLDIEEQENIGKDSVETQELQAVAEKVVKASKKRAPKVIKLKKKIVLTEDA